MSFFDLCSATSLYVRLFSDMLGGCLERIGDSRLECAQWVRDRGNEAVSSESGAAGIESEAMNVFLGLAGSPLLKVRLYSQLVVR